MKTLKLTALFVLLLVAVIGISSANAKVPEQKKDVREILKEAINYPEFALNEGDEAKVDVSFRIADDGTLQIRKVSSADPKFSKYVREKLEKINLSGILVDKFKTYQLSIRFELE